jgi:rhodanese-related sulfurtransferase
MGELARRLGEIDASAEVVAICHHGGRSLQVALFLEKNGFAAVHNLVGGVDAWSRAVDPSVPTY